MNDFTDADDTSSEDDPVEPFPSFFERQVDARCGLHALNNALGGMYLNIADMQNALEDYLVSSQREGLNEQRSAHFKPSGWYSSEVMCHALNTASMHKKGRIEHVLELKALYLHPHLIHICIGAIVNIDNKHWCALRSIGGQIWRLDSLNKHPEKLTQNEYIAFVNKRRAAYPIMMAENMASSSSASHENSSPVLPMVDTQDSVCSAE